MAQIHRRDAQTETNMTTDASGGERASPIQRVGYIEELVAELEGLAVGPELARLRDLLGLARREARAVALGKTS